MEPNVEPELDCHEALHRIYHFLDGELTDDRRAKITAHLNSCSPCFDRFGFESEIRKLVQCKCQETVPDSLRQKIADAINHEHDKATT